MSERVVYIEGRKPLSVDEGTRLMLERCNRQPKCILQYINAMPSKMANKYAGKFNSMGGNYIFRKQGPQYVYVLKK